MCLFSFGGLGLSESGNLGSGLLQGGQQAEKSLLSLLWWVRCIFHWENLQVWGRVEVFVEGLLLQENELRLSEISEGLQWQDQQKKRALTSYSIYWWDASSRVWDYRLLSSGRVEIVKHNQWGTIDDALFDNLDAQVICRSASCDGLAWPTTCRTHPKR